ncbi:hypothetical protein [Mesorhizobium sp. CN2-181]|uniref:hypothetical protein n=1 Tax=Mesorhizobium yinganensis TaxID=3157707 RepID=UPI0032B802CD
MQSDLQPDESVAAAGRWLASDPARAGAILPEIKTRFGLTTPEAIEAIRLANAIRRETGGAHHAS